MSLLLQRERLVRQGSARLKLVLRTVDDLLLHARIQIFKIRRVAGDADEQLRIVFGMFCSVYKRVMGGDVELDFHATVTLAVGTIEVSLHVSDELVDHFVSFTFRGEFQIQSNSI